MREAGVKLSVSCREVCRTTTSSSAECSSLPWTACALALVLLSSCALRAEGQTKESSCYGDHDPAQSQSSVKSGSVSNGISPTLGPHGIKLTWNPSPSPNATVVGYNLFRREVGPNCQQKNNRCHQVNRTVISGTTCVDYSAEAGHTYIYQAQTVGHGGVVSVMSNEAKATAIVP